MAMEQDTMVVSLRGGRRTDDAPVPRRRKKPPYGLIGLSILLLLIMAAGVYFRDSIPGISRLGQTSSAAQSAQEQAEEVQDLVKAVGKLIVLPEGEEPTVASVTDPEKLKDQPFFQNAKAGDKVLIYTKARKAYLYDPQKNKLIEVAPLTVDATE